jgi:hypothetical protein
MPNEIVIPEALSGYEIKRSILHTVESILNKDCYLRDDTSYLKYGGVISIKVRLHDVGGTPTVEREIPVDFGKVPEGENEDEFLDQYEVEHEIVEQDPNTVRQESEQPIPVLTSKGGKNVIERVKYSPKKGKK